MKNPLLIFLLCISLVAGSYTEAKATVVNPLTVAMGAGLIVVSAGGVYYYLRNGGTSGASGDYFTRQAAAAYITLNTANGLYQNTVKNLTASLSTEKARAAALSDPASFPHLAALLAARLPPDHKPTFNEKVGDDLIFGGQKYKISSIPASHGGGLSCFPTGYPSPVHIETAPAGKFLVGWSSGGGANCGTGSGYSSYLYCEIGLGPNPEPAPPVVPSASEFRDSAAPSGTVSDSGYQAELDKMMQNPAYVPTFNDETGLPWAPPADVVSPATAIADETKAAARAAAAAATQTAQNAVAAASSAASAAHAAAAANPSDPALAARAAAADADLASAEAEAAQATAQEAALVADQAAAEEEAEDSPASVDPPPQLKSFDWTYGRKLLGSLETAWPFNLLLSLRGLFAPLSSDPVAPAFDLPIYGSNVLHINLSFFDPIAAICRWAITILLTSLGIMQVIRWYRGV